MGEPWNVHPSFAETHILGIAVSPLTRRDAESDHEATLRQFLNLGVPVAVCQPPAEPGALVKPELVSRLASEYPNFVLFEDSSGQDRVAMSSADLHNVRKLRGAQGNFIPSTKSMGGSYDGLMAGAANGFGMQLAEMLGFLDEGYASQAVNLITPVQRVTEEASSAVAALPFGNRFANAHHAIDHFLAYGREPRVAPTLDWWAHVSRRGSGSCQNRIGRKRFLAFERLSV